MTTFPDPAHAGARPLGRIDYLDPTSTDPLRSRKWVADRSDLVVAMASWAKRDDLVGLLNGTRPAAYVIAGATPAGRLQVYVGESIDVMRRLGNHGVDARKAFAQEVVVIATREGELDKKALLALQYEAARRLTLLGHAPSLVSGFPRPPKDPDGRLGKLARRMVDDALRVLSADGYAFAGPVQPDPPGADDPRVHLSRATLAARGAAFFVLKTPKIHAEVARIDDLAIVLAGSEIRLAATRTSSGPLESVVLHWRASGAVVPLLAKPGVGVVTRNLAMRFTTATTLTTCLTGRKAMDREWWRVLGSEAHRDPDEVERVCRLFGMPSPKS